MAWLPALLRQRRFHNWLGMVVGMSEVDQAWQSAVAEQLSNAIIEQNESRFKVIAFVHRHGIIESLTEASERTELIDELREANTHLLETLTEAAEFLGCLGGREGQRRGDMADRIRAALAKASSA